ncbi:hypothetical protein F2Q69_00032230 [Brassica cretica]|uniref:Bidirectional sugar transporter SWEET n=1 Tax=Brassica cretica TaxID=69181 RepID=A0A8S9S7B1_BRACR|nr:hypothetical protein F2Q69_00032230 [Brassica cretica]
MVMKCCLWILYGLPLVQKDSILVTTSNGVGLVIEVIYLVVFFIYSDKNLQLERMEATGACLIVEIGVAQCSMLVTTQESPTKFQRPRFRVK